MELLDKKIIQEKTKNDVKSTIYLLIEESKKKYSVVSYTSYEKWSMDGKSFHVVFQTKSEALKYFENLKEA